jgi:hypothetical protein
MPPSDATYKHNSFYLKNQGRAIGGITKSLLNITRCNDFTQYSIRALMAVYQNPDILRRAKTGEIGLPKKAIIIHFTFVMLNMPHLLSAQFIPNGDADLLHHIRWVSQGDMKKVVFSSSLTAL